MGMRLGHIELFVADVERSRRFYVEILGFEIVADQGTFVWVRSGALEVLLRPILAESDGAAWVGRYDRPRGGLVLHTDPLATAVARLRTLGVELGTTDQNDGCLTFQDPDGHWLQLVSPEG